MLIDCLQMGYVNGFAYKQVLPAPDAEIPERFQRAEQVFAQKLWREQLRDWDENRKPSAIAMHRELQADGPHPPHRRRHASGSNPLRPFEASEL
jgi:hypothetical protein